MASNLGNIRRLAESGIKPRSESVAASSSASAFGPALTSLNDGL